jgi:hypothetical protein
VDGKHLVEFTELVEKAERQILDMRMTTTAEMKGGQLLTNILLSFQTVSKANRKLLQATRMVYSLSDHKTIDQDGLRSAALQALLFPSV